MESQLQQAIKRLEAAVSKLETAPLGESSKAESKDTTATKAELAEIKSLVEQAMAMLKAPPKKSSKEY